jgi:riboflavin kinase/FMN adenylyltransferase
VKIIRDIVDEDKNYQNAVVALGNFDGFHLGHRSIIADAKEIAKTTTGNFPLGVMSFEPHPRFFFKKENNLKIYNMRDKLLVMKELEVDFVFMMRFNQEFANLSAHNFIHELLVKKLHVKHIVTGENFCFGKNRIGNNDLLAKEAAALGFGYTAHKQVCTANGEPISSSAIREFLAQGEVQKAANLLGKPYHITGRVQHGEKRGQTIGFPTANVSLEKLFLPCFGVYAVRAKIEGKTKTYDGIANLGIKPTFGNYAPCLEVHLFNTKQNLYGKRLVVEFVSFIRREQKFTSIAELKIQIENDSKQAKKVLNLENEV